MLEQQRELGILKSVGYTSGTVLSEVLLRERRRRWSRRVAGYAVRDLSDDSAGEAPLQCQF